MKKFFLFILLGVVSFTTINMVVKRQTDSRPQMAVEQRHERRQDSVEKKAEKGHLVEIKTPFGKIGIL